MKVQVLINDKDYSNALLGTGENHPDGVEELEITTEDEEGRGGISAVKLNLCDLEDEAIELLNVESMGKLRLMARGLKIFEGHLDCPNFNYDDENDIVTVKAIGYEAKLLSDLELITVDKVLGTVNDNGTVSQYGGATIQVNYRSVADPKTDYAYRKFWSAKHIITKIFEKAGVTVTITGIDEDIYIGGKIMGTGDGSIALHYYDIAPKDTAREFLAELCKLFNATWCMSSTDTATFWTKIAQITSVNNAYPSGGYTGEILKNETTLGLNQNGYDSITLNNSDEHSREPGDTRTSDGRILSREALNGRTKNLQLKFMFPVYSATVAPSIGQEFDEPYFVVRATYTSGVYTISGIYPNEILNRYYAFELKGTHEADITYSLIDDDSLSELLFIPYMRLAPTQLYPQDFSTYYMRTISLNPQGETVNVKAMGYWL